MQNSPLRSVWCCFPCELPCQPSDLWNLSWLNRIATLLARCLRLTTIITDDSSRLTTVGWLNLIQTGFPPVRLIALSWAHNSNFPYLGTHLLALRQEASLALKSSVNSSLSNSQNMHFIPLLIIANKLQMFYLDFEWGQYRQTAKCNLSIEITLLPNYQSHFLSALSCNYNKYFIQFTQSIHIML